MKDERPNIILFITDEQRGDCLGIDGHPVLQTPVLDQLAAQGARFRKAYTACPVCVPARRTLMSGQKPASHGVFMNSSCALQGATLPGELSKAGYQTHLVGKLHLSPRRKLYGFDSADWADSPFDVPEFDDYQRYLRQQGVQLRDAGVTHGANQNGWVARPWPLAEHLHFTNWCAEKALEFLERRDPTTPFFLKVSFHQPHAPCCPPQVYWNRYMNMDLPGPDVGDWAKVFDQPQRGLPVASWRTSLDPLVLKQYRAGYFGCINHIDEQIGRVLHRRPANTIVLFVSDHGEMLGDHQWIRKRNAFEASARIPFIINGLPGARGEQVRDEPVELMDVMPTLLEAAGVVIPDSVDGSSLAPLLRGETSAWRDYVHGECSEVPSLGSGMQYVTDGKRKFIWYPGNGSEQYFDLEADPREMHELIDDASRADEINVWRQRLIRELVGRPEGFTDGQKLTPVGGPTAGVLPGTPDGRTLLR